MEPLFDDDKGSLSFFRGIENGKVQIKKNKSEMIKEQRKEQRI